MKRKKISKLPFLTVPAIVAILTACPSADSIRGSKPGTVFPKPVIDPAAENLTTGGTIVPSIIKDSLTFRANSNRVLTLSFNTNVEIVDDSKINVEVKAASGLPFANTPVSSSKVNTKNLLELTLVTPAIDYNIYRVRVGTGAIRTTASKLANTAKLTSSETTYSTSPILDRANRPYILNSKLVATFNLSIALKDREKVKVYKDPAEDNDGEEVLLNDGDVAVNSISKNLLEITLPTVAEDEVYRLRLEAGAVNEEGRKANENKAITPAGLDITIKAAPALGDKAPYLSGEKIIVPFDEPISILDPEKIKYQLDDSSPAKSDITPKVVNKNQLEITPEDTPEAGQTYRIQLEAGAITGRNSVPSVAIRPDDKDIIVWDIAAMKPVFTSDTEFSITFPANMEIVDTGKIKVEVKGADESEFKAATANSAVNKSTRNLLELTLSTPAAHKNVYRVKVGAEALRVTAKNMNNNIELTSGEAIYFTSLILDNASHPYILNNKLVATFNLPIALRDWKKVKVYKNTAGDRDREEISLAEPDIAVKNKNLLEIILPGVTAAEVYRLELGAGAVNEEDNADNENKAIEPKDLDITIGAAPALTAKPLSLGRNKIIVTFDVPISILDPNKIKYQVSDSTPERAETTPKVVSNNQLEIPLNFDPNEGEVYRIDLEAGALSGGKNKPFTGKIQQEITVPELTLENVTPVFTSKTKFSVSFPVEVAISDGGDSYIEVRKKDDGALRFELVGNRIIAVDETDAKKINITLTSDEEIIPYTQVWKVVFLNSAMETAKSGIINLNNLTTNEVRPRITDLYGWEEVPTSGSNKWSARSRHTSVVFNPDGTGDRIWVLGGEDGTHIFNDVWSSADGANWTRVDDAADWKARYDHTSVVFNPDGTGEKIWVMGGKDSTNIFNDVWNSADGVNWTRVNDVANWEARSGHTSVVFNPERSGEKIWVMGGSSPSFKKDVWSSTNGSEWVEESARAGADVGWNERFRHTSAVFNGKIWMIGGDSITGKTNSVWSSTDGRDWNKGAPLNTVVYEARMVEYNSRLWSLGGGVSKTKSFWSSENPTTGWTSENALSSEIRSTQAVVFKNKIWLLGGEYGGTQTNKVWKMGPASP